MKILTTQSQLRKAKHEPGLHFLCADCGQTKPVQTNGGTGYGYFGRSNRAKPVCYDCCGKRDVANMAKTGKATLYLSHNTNGNTHGNFAPSCEPSGDRVPVWTVGNWPGTFKRSAYVKTGNHNMAGKRYDAWFTMPDGSKWHGVTYGDNTQICHCRRLKS